MISPGVGTATPPAQHAAIVAHLDPAAIGAWQARYPEAPPTSPSKSQTTGTTPSGNENHGALLRDAELAIAAFVPADKQDAILMLLRLDRALLELFAVRGRNMTAYHTTKAKDGLS